MSSHICTYAFHGNRYCDVPMGSEFINIICRRLQDGRALCIGWDKLGPDAPSVPSTNSIKTAQLIARVAFAIEDWRMGDERDVRQ